MEEKKINIGNVILRILEVLIAKIFMLPFQIYRNALIDLSNSKSDDSDEKNLSEDFPIYVWYVSIFSAIIALTYPIGIIIAILRLIGDPSVGIMFLVVLYFIPLFIGLFRELLLITLKSLLFLKIISKNSTLQNQRNREQQSDDIS